MSTFTKTVLTALTVTGLTVGVANSAEPIKPTLAAPTSSELLTTLSNPELSWEKRKAAGEALAKKPNLEVLTLLLPKIIAGPTAINYHGMLGDSDQFTADKRWSAGEQVDYAVKRQWAWHWAKASEMKQTFPQIRRALVASLPYSPTSLYVLKELESHWIEEAEAPVTKIFRSKESRPSEIMQALKCLLRNSENDYVPEAKKMARAIPNKPEINLRFKNEMVSWLVNHCIDVNSNTHSKAIDWDLVKLGFEVVQELQQETPAGGYFMATTIGRYVGQEFTPNPNDPKYKGKYELKAEFFSESTKNALAWWKKQKH